MLGCIFNIAVTNFRFKSLLIYYADVYEFECADKIVLFISKNCFLFLSSYITIYVTNKKHHQNHFNFSFANIKYAYVAFIDQFRRLFCGRLAIFSTLHFKKG